MLIIGWGNRKTKDFGAVFPTTCTNCNNEIEYHLVRARDWVDLFFIPIFPYQSEWFLLCPTCENGIKIEKDKDITLSKEMCEYAKKLINKEISE